MNADERRLKTRMLSAFIGVYRRLCWVSFPASYGSGSQSRPRPSRDRQGAVSGIAVSGCGALAWLLQAPMLCLGLAAPSPPSAVEHNPNTRTWSVRSGAVEYRLRDRDGAVRIVYLGPVGRPDWPAAVGRQSNPLSRYDVAGLVDGQTLMPEDLRLVAHEVRRPRPETAALRLLYRHRRIPLEIEAVYTAWGDTGVLTRQLTFSNRSAAPLLMESAPSLSWCLPPGEYTLDYLHGLWGEERQLASENIGPGRRAFVNNTGRSSDGYSPWFSLRNNALGVRYAAQLAYSGNWEMFFERHVERRLVSWNGHELRAEMGMRFDFGGPAPLAPGASFQLPEVAFTATAGDLDDAANQLHRYQRRYVVARTPANEPPLTQFNSWYPLQRTPKAADVKRYAAYAADLGIEAFVIDAGWFPYRAGKPDPVFGDWEADPATFPKGLRDVADFVHGKGMKFGVWLEIECASTDSRVVREHPDWVLRYNGAPLPGTRTRVYLNFGKPEVRKWARAVVDRLVREDKVDWFKLDYNVDVGQYFDPPAPGRSGTVLYDHLRHYFAFLDEIRAAYPNVVLENCSSGGLRMDLAIIAHTHTTWLSDVVDPRQSVQLAYGCTMEFTPGVCNHWMVGDEHDGTVDLARPPAWWDFLFRVAMNGQFGLSSRVSDWNAALKQRAAENVALYKRLRTLVSGADVYHLTPPPAAGRDPEGWMALQYASEDRRRSALMAYRLGRSQPGRIFRLRGLDPVVRYRVSEAGRALGAFTGKQLEMDGLPVALDAEWRSAAIELDAER
jgi:alpha-galactosidase